MLPSVKSSPKRGYDPEVNVVKEMKSLSLSISDNEEPSKKKPDIKSASDIDTTVNNENAKHLSENNIRTNYLRITEKLFTQQNKNASLQQQKQSYELGKYKKNAMIIFNHEIFLIQGRRFDNALDVTALEDTFKQFRFDVTTRNDFTKQNLFDELKEFSKMNFNDYGCICVAILTHGQDGGFLWAYDTRYNERDVFSCFDTLTNPSLMAKPIIFLIQACRGPSTAARVPYSPFDNVEFDADTVENKGRPTESDMIIFHCSFFGRASVRLKEGSWFIQTLCEQIKQHGSTDHLEKLFRRVRRIVALKKEHKGAKQMPAVTTTLLKKLYLKKIDDMNEEMDSNSVRASCATVKTRLTNTELKTIAITMLKHVLRIAFAAVLTYQILLLYVAPSTGILIAFVFLFELVRCTVYKVYIALFKEVHRFTMFLVLFNFFVRLYRFFVGILDYVPLYVYLVGSWYSMGHVTGAIYAVLILCFY